MSAKGYITGNDAADRILRGEVPCSEKALQRVVDSERIRTVNALRGRLRLLPDNASRYAVATVLEEMELDLGAG
jgi:hypothetical protein